MRRARSLQRLTRIPRVRSFADTRINPTRRVRVPSTCANERCEAKEICPSSAHTERNAKKRKAMEEERALMEHDDGVGRGLPSVSSLFPYGPGSTDPKEWPLRSFYRRELPSSCVKFSSKEGITLFQESLAQGTAAAYFPLAEQFRTQDEPAFCGLSTLTMVLNSLAIDPGRIWKGGWRWFSEEMLDCCESLEKIRKQGISFEKLACLASCNGADVDTWRADGKQTNEKMFREAVIEACKDTDRFLIASYSRSALGQTGEGHFSPVAAYHKDKDMVLIMDTARFKYPPHWVSLPLLYEAMVKEDPTGMPRGYMSLVRASGDGNPTSSVLFVLTLREGFDETALRSIRRFFANVKLAKETKKALAEKNQQQQQQQQQNHPNSTADDASEAECKICSSDGLEISAYVECFLTTVPEELLNAVSTVVHEFRVDPEHFGELSVRPQYQAVVEDLLKDIRDLAVYPHVVTAAKRHPDRLTGILQAAHGLELLTVLLLAAPVHDLSACGTRVDAVMRASEEGASEIVRNEIAALRNQLWTVFQPRATRSGDNAKQEIEQACASQT